MRLKHVAATFASVIALLLILGEGIYCWGRYAGAEREQRIQQTYLERPSDFAELVAVWRVTVPAVTPCGDPNREPGLVQWRVFEMRSDGSYRVGINLEDYEKLSLAAAAEKLDVPSSAVGQLVASLKKVGYNEISQSDAEVVVRNADWNSDELMYMPPTCPESIGYAPSIDAHDYMHFVHLRGLGNNWFYYVERR